MLAWFEHGRGKGCVRKEFPYVRKPCKDYRLEAKWEANDAKCFDATNAQLERREKAPTFSRPTPSVM